MDRKRQLSLVFALIGIALGVGHIVQNGADTSAAAAAPQPTNVDFVSAGPEQTQPQTANVAVRVDVSLPEPVQPPKTASAATGAAPATAGVLDTPAPATDLVIPVAPPVVPQTVSTDPVAPAAPVVTPRPAATFSGAGSDAVAPVITEAPSLTAPAQSVPQPAPSTATETADACAMTMKVALAPQAMIGVSIMAPCAPEARVVIEHEGLTITQKTDATGSVFLAIPAMAVDANVVAYVADADPISESLRVPAMATLRRFGVQWQDKDAFQLHAFENGADYGDAGHLSADDPHTPLTGAPPAGGYLTLLGDADVVLPLLAEVYTFPVSGIANSDVLVEAAVTEATCGREMLGETIMTLAGEATTTELTLAMPDCDGVGDILVLKNLVTDLTIAAAN